MSEPNFLPDLLQAIAVTWLIVQGRELHSTITAFPEGQRLRYTLDHILTCSKCLGFWLALLISLSPITASLASLSMALIAKHLYS